MKSSLAMLMNPEVILFKNKTVEIKRRAFKRSIGVTLQVNGKILVSAPKMVSVRKIQDFLLRHSDWISSNLEKYDELRGRYPAKSYQEGEELLFLGEKLPIRYAETSLKKLGIEIEDSQIVCRIPREFFKTFDPRIAHPELRSVFVKFFEAQGRAYLVGRIEILSKQMQLLPKAVSFRSQKTRWGSCSSAGKLSFNWKLIIAPRAVVDYVIVHEIAHLKFHNHSKNFWNLVHENCPQYREHRHWLRIHQFEADFLSRESELHHF